MKKPLRVWLISGVLSGVVFAFVLPTLAAVGGMLLDAVGAYPLAVYGTSPWAGVDQYIIAMLIVGPPFLGFIGVIFSGLFKDLEKDTTKRSALKRGISTVTRMFLALLPLLGGIGIVAVSSGELNFLVGVVTVVTTLLALYITVTSLFCFYFALSKKF